MYATDNINTLINLSLVLTKVNEKSYKKAIIFVSVITIVYSLNFLYIVFFVLFMGKDLFEAGSYYYLAHSFFDFAVILFYFIIILSYGSVANDIDF